MTPELFVVIDDRAAPPASLKGLIGYMHFGDLLRRRARYVDELAAATATADDVIILRTEDDADHLIRKIENNRSEALWFRLPITSAPMNMDALDQFTRKSRFALDPLLISPIVDDDAPAVLFGRDAAALVETTAGKERRSFFLKFAERAGTVAHDINFIDLRQPEGLRRFLTNATEPRGFNNLSNEGDVFVKSSTDKAKMRAEHTFFQLASPKMQRFLLPTFDYAETAASASYKMEHLRIPDAALQFVLGGLEAAQFEQLLGQFFNFIEARDLEKVGSKTVERSGTDQILTKMDRRLDAFLESEDGRHIDGQLKCGGIPDGLRGLQARATPLIKGALSSFGGDHFAFSHGDPCLSNILFDGRIGLIRLIDPRGAIESADAMMHPLYDIAKLSHSICGGYDFVNNGLFSIEVNSDLKFELNFHRGGTPGWMREEFIQKLHDQGWDYRQVRAVEASLFLSMLPLHMDHPRKVLGFALIAQTIISELESL